MVQSSSISITPATHADRHRTGGADPLTGAVGIDAMAPAAHKVTHEVSGVDPLTSELIASDTVLHTSAAEKSTALETYTKLKEVKADNIKGTVRVSFDLRAGLNISHSGRVYINGVGVGTVRTKATTGSQTYTEDFAGVVTGDLIQVYAKKNTADGFTVYVNDLVIKGVLEIGTYTNQDP